MLSGEKKKDHPAEADKPGSFDCVQAAGLLQGGYFGRDSLPQAIIISRLIRPLYFKIMAKLLGRKSACDVVAFILSRS